MKCFSPLQGLLFPHRSLQYGHGKHVVALSLQLWRFLSTAYRKALTSCLSSLPPPSPIGWRAECCRMLTDSATLLLSVGGYTSYMKCFKGFSVLFKSYFWSSLAIFSALHWLWMFASFQFTVLERCLGHFKENASHCPQSILQLKLTACLEVSNVLGLNGVQGWIQDKAK